MWMVGGERSLARYATGIENVPATARQEESRGRNKNQRGRSDQNLTPAIDPVAVRCFCVALCPYLFGAPPAPPPPPPTAHKSSR